MSDAKASEQDAIGSVLSELRGQLLRYRADRQPFEHATAQFHLGASLLQIDRLDEAMRALETAATLFESHDHPVELAKATNMLGVVHRSAGRRDAALSAFERAEALFAAHDQPADQGAAGYNLGLLQRDAGQEREAADRFAAALERFHEVGAPAQASSAARELGTSLFSLGDLDAALATLERAGQLAERAGELGALGAAANVRGLVLLGAERFDEAVAAFEVAVGANPRRLRPDGFAMAKANLALASEQAGRLALARLAAKQAVATPAVPEPVTAQAREVLDRLGADADDLHALLDEEPSERWVIIVRDELVRWAEDRDADRLIEAGGWIDGQLGRPETAEQRAGVWLEVLLEQPPEVLERVASATLRALADRGTEDRERFRATVRRASARFGVPQLIRIEDVFERLAEDVGLSWR